MGLFSPAGAADLDDMVMLFITTAWEEGETRAVADNLISDLKDADPDLLGQRLKGSARLMRAWRANEVVCRSAPISWPMVKALVGLCLHWG